MNTAPTKRNPPAFAVATLLALAVPLCVTLAMTTAYADEKDDRARIGAMLDDFHAAAAEADRERYLGHFTEQGVFMGTDDWERWPLPEFTEYVAGRFENGGGWEYHPESRHIAFDADTDTAWFDEIAVSPRWGRFRGTGVVIRTDAGWKLAHYSLTALVPNELFRDVSDLTRPGFEARSEKSN
ncbi:MAG: nuclear transport factor 2 family protein [Pseudomonadota bacterium]